MKWKLISVILMAVGIMCLVACGNSQHISDEEMDALVEQLYAEDGDVKKVEEPKKQKSIKKEKLVDENDTIEGFDSSLYPLINNTEGLSCTLWKMSNADYVDNTNMQLISSEGDDYTYASNDGILLLRKSGVSYCKIQYPLDYVYKEEFCIHDAIYDQYFAEGVSVEDLLNLHYDEVVNIFGGNGLMIGYQDRMHIYVMWGSPKNQKCVLVDFLVSNGCSDSAVACDSSDLGYIIK